MDDNTIQGLTSTCQTNVPAFGNEHTVQMGRAHAVGERKPWHDTSKQHGSSATSSA